MNDARKPSTESALVPIIRPADTSDLTAVLALDRHLRDALVGRRGADAWLCEHPPLDAAGLGNFRHLDVAEFEGEIVGFIVSVDRHVESRGRICTVDRVYVSPAFREIGCGDALLAGVLNDASARRCAFIEGEALPGDRETKNLYERAGITARLITVSKEISAPSTEEDASR